MTATAIIIATLASGALGVGVWLVMTGAVIAAFAGDVAIEADRWLYRCDGALMVLLGLTLFVAGTIAGIEVMA